MRTRIVVHPTVSAGAVQLLHGAVDCVVLELAGGAMGLLETVDVDTNVDVPELLVDSTTVYVLSCDSVTVTVLLPEVCV